MANKRNGKSKGDKNRDVNGKMGVSLGEFDSTDVGSGAAEGRSAGAGAEMPDSRSEDVSMANVKADDRLLRARPRCQAARLDREAGRRPHRTQGHPGQGQELAHAHPDQERVQGDDPELLPAIGGRG